MLASNIGLALTEAENLFLRAAHDVLDPDAVDDTSKRLTDILVEMLLGGVPAEILRDFPGTHPERCTRWRPHCQRDWANWVDAAIMEAAKRANPGVQLAGAAALMSGTQLEPSLRKRPPFCCINGNNCIGSMSEGAWEHVAAPLLYLAQSLCRVTSKRIANGR